MRAIDGMQRINQNLTFSDLPLQQAIRLLFNDPGFTRSERLLIEDAGREWILQKVISFLPTEMVGRYRFEHILLSVNQFRKMDRTHREKRLIILEHAENLKEARCFYEGKVSTDCVETVDLDRVRPGSRGGEYTVENTVLSCSRHNRQRGCKEVVEYWKQ